MKNAGGEVKMRMKIFDGDRQFKKLIDEEDFLDEIYLVLSVMNEKSNLKQGMLAGILKKIKKRRDALVHNKQILFKGL